MFILNLVRKMVFNSLSLLPLSPMITVAVWAVHRCVYREDIRAKLRLMQALSLYSTTIVLICQVQLSLFVESGSKQLINYCLIFCLLCSQVWVARGFFVLMSSYTDYLFLKSYLKTRFIQVSHRLSSKLVHRILDGELRDSILASIRDSGFTFDILIPSQ